MQLLINGVVKFICGLLLVGALLFVPAGTLDYSGGWLFMALLFIPVLIMGAVLYIKAPELLAKRLDVKEKQSAQRYVVAFSGLGLLAGFIVSALDFRFGWLPMPRCVNLVGATLFLAAYLLYAEVLRENTYLSRTIEVQEHQTVIDTGLYGIVRHPMYSATLVLFLAMPLVLGSLWALVIFLAYPFIIVTRLRHEEAFLEENLDGYRAYKQKVKYRLIPFVW